MAAAIEGDFLVQAATYLGAAAIAVPIFNRLKLGSILGYLAAGIIAGPFGLALLHEQEGVFHIAELGVVLFLFVIGLELSLSRLWLMRAQIFGLGAAQMLLTGFVIAAAFVAASVMPANAAIIAGFSFAFSSTALALQLLRERGEMNTSHGARSFSILLFQDLAVIPLLALVPLIAGVAGGGDSVAVGVAKAVFVIAVLIAIGRYFLDPILRIVAKSGSREAFAAMALFLVALTSLAVSWAGLSMALGAFLAGVLMAESSYRHQIETDIEPFRGLLLGLFFISIGMRLDLDLIAASWWIVGLSAVGLVTIKAGLLYVITRIAGAAHPDALRVAATLSQGGEFAFVIISLGAGAALFTPSAASLMSAIITISMALTPLAVFLAQRFSIPAPQSEEGLDGPENAQGHVIIAGFGRMGQIIAQVLNASGTQVTAIDNDPAHIRNAQRYGFKVYYGDASRLDVLITAGAMDARAVVLCMDSREAVNHAAERLRAYSPTALILAVAHDRLHEIDLHPIGVDYVVRETLESSLALSREALSRMGHEHATIEGFVEQFRKLDRERLLAQADHGEEAGMELLHQSFTAVSTPSKTD